MQDRIHVAVTGLNATDNPGPGVSVIRSLRHDPNFEGRIIGLAYDNLEPGVYARDLVDDVFMIPYPSQGKDALRTRLAYIHGRVRLDAIIPTLDSELPEFIALDGELAEMGIGTYLPTQDQVDLRAKNRLVELGECSGIAVPKTVTLRDERDLYSLHEHMQFPVAIKGPFYGAEIVHSVSDAVRAYYAALAKWGAPIIAQAFISGEEFDVVAVGDGEGGLVGAVPMRKTFLTDKGKGWAGIAIRDPKLLDITERFMAATKWRGPCEVEVIKDKHGDFHLLEVNPRFPAWVFLSAAAGLNLPSATLQLALGQSVEPSTTYEAGTMFVRIAIDQIAHLADYRELTMTGELLSRGAIS